MINDFFSLPNIWCYSIKNSLILKSANICKGAVRSCWKFPFRIKYFNSHFDAGKSRNFWRKYLTVPGICFIWYLEIDILNWVDPNSYLSFSTNFFNPLWNNNNFMAILKTVYIELILLWVFFSRSFLDFMFLYHKYISKDIYTEIYKNGVF